MRDRYDILAIGAHPDDVEVFMGGTVAKLTGQGLTALLVDLCSGEPTRHASAGLMAREGTEPGRHQLTNDGRIGPTGQADQSRTTTGPEARR